MWPEVAPFVDGKALQGAERLGLPASPAKLVELAGSAGPTDGHEVAVLAAALVRAALDKHVVDDVRSHA